MDNIVLSNEQKRIFDLMENTKQNLFITGKAGSGKSYLLNYFRTFTKKNALYTAPTGMAALNIDGVTLHSAFGFDNLKDEHYIKISENQTWLLKKLDTLVIDEVSMVRVDMFEQIDKILKKANNNSAPFGGKQVIIFGDIFQLPPIVATKEEKEYFYNKYGNSFFFYSNAYKNGGFVFMELEEIHRQTDKKFIDILNAVREGKLSEHDASILNQHYTPFIPENVLHLVPKRAISEQINQRFLNRIEEKEYIYNATISAGNIKYIKEKDYRCDFKLKLKVGASVMMIANDKEQKRWVNGTLGVIKELSDKYIKVNINGKEYDVGRYDFIKYRCVYDREKQKLSYVVQSCVSQFPLILAYAITIHKAQGMTCNQVICDLEECFAPGQSYVALSRCKSIENLYLVNRIDPNVVMVDRAILNFYYNQIRKVS